VGSAAGAMHVCYPYTYTNIPTEGQAIPRHALVVAVVVVIAADAVVVGGVAVRLICRTSLMTKVRRPASKECWYWPLSVFHDLVTFSGSSVPRCSKEWFFKIHFVYCLSFNRFLCSLCFYLRRVTHHSCLTVDGR
jgi:hypothetical protein